MRIILTLLLFVGNIAMLLFILKFPREVLDAAKDGLMLWFNNVLPALLPFIVITNMLVGLGFVRVMGNFMRPIMQYVFGLPGAGSLALIVGLISGYPMGAKTVADLCKNGEITTKEAQHLLKFCNNAGPLFIVGVVGVGLLGDSTAGYVLWAAHGVTALFMGIVTRTQWNCNDFNKNVTLKIGSPNVAKVLSDSIKNAMDALLFVGGLIIFFSVVVRMLLLIFGDAYYMGVAAGIIEMTNGAKMLADTTGAVSAASLAAIGGIIGFGGISVHAQAAHFTAGIGVRVGEYIKYKLLHGLLAAGVTWLIWTIK